MSPQETPRRRHALAPEEIRTRLGAIVEHYRSLTISEREDFGSSGLRLTRKKGKGNMLIAEVKYGDVAVVELALDPEGYFGTGRRRTVPEPQIVELSERMGALNLPRPAWLDEDER